jgi:molecular chaperone GrpE
MDPEGPDRRSMDGERQIPVRTVSPGSPPERADAQPELSTAEDNTEVWRDRALRLQAEMENYRKRQRRLAKERIVEERERLLRRFLQVADELERALAASRDEATSLRQGVELTHRTLMQHLEQEGVEPIPAQGQPFDPEWHEAVGTTTEHGPGIQSQTVVEVLRPGYRLDGRLLRPARVLISA